MALSLLLFLFNLKGHVVPSIVQPSLAKHDTGCSYLCSNVTNLGRCKPFFFMQSIFKPCNSFRYSNTIKLELI
jgi:hypothetical protein